MASAAKKIEKLEERVESLKRQVKTWQSRYYAAKKKIQKLEDEINLNPSEIKQLEIENGRLLVELNRYKRKLRGVEGGKEKESGTREKVLGR